MTTNRDGRVVVHDYSGHPFQVELARKLAAMGRPTAHVHCPSFQTPHGNLAKGPDDPALLEFVAVSNAKPFEKYRSGRRFLQELEYGWRAGRQIAALEPAVVISANVPLLAAVVFQVMMLVRRIPVVFWQQDVYSVAMAGHLERHVPLVGGVLGRLVVKAEQFLLRTSRQIVTISGDFVPILTDWHVDTSKVTVVENWAPLDELAVRPKQNDWATRQGLADTTVVLYSGTLGLKHDPSLLLALAKRMDERDEGILVVASEGRGASWLEEHGAGVERLRLLDFQPYDDLPDMLGTADVLVALLEPEAGVFSVPSKILTYHCAGRAILAAVPEANLSARIIGREGSGICVAPDDAAAFVAALDTLLDDADLRKQSGKNARAYAEREFDIDRTGARFEEIIQAALGPGAKVRAT